jgi:hypothetical protein
MTARRKKRAVITDDQLDDLYDRFRDLIETAFEPGERAAALFWLNEWYVVYSACAEIGFISGRHPPKGGAK